MDRGRRGELPLSVKKPLRCGIGFFVRGSGHREAAVRQCCPLAGKRDPETASSANLALDLDSASMGFDDRLGD